MPSTGARAVRERNTTVSGLHGLPERGVGQRYARASNEKTGSFQNKLTACMGQCTVVTPRLEVVPMADADKGRTREEKIDLGSTKRVRLWR